MKKQKGLFLTIEGGEGAGKSSLVTHLVGKLKEKGLEVVSTFEPGDTPLGQKIRALLLDVKEGVSISEKAELLLFLADRAQHIETCIAPALERGAVVICDRFTDSTIAYQGFARELDLTYVRSLATTVVGGLQPDVTLLLDIDPKTGLERSRALASDDRMEAENLTFHQKLRSGFLALAQEESRRIHLLDASKAKQEVFDAAWGIVSSYV